MRTRGGGEEGSGRRGCTKRKVWAALSVMTDEEEGRRGSDTGLTGEESGEEEREGVRETRRGAEKG